MAESSIASAVAVPEAMGEQSLGSNSLKRRQAEELEEEHESKKQRINPGKNSPAAPADDAEYAKNTVEETAPEQPKVDSREPRRKASIADEKQRSKRLFGALLGSLNQPGDRTSKRRHEIESRRKAELQRQDDELVEDKLRRQEKLAEQRRREQEKIDEQNIHTRHSSLLHAANFLQTAAEPKLYYRPWDLRPDEEDRIDAQIREAQAQIDRELEEFQQRHLRNGHEDERRNPTHSPSQTRTMSPEQDRQSLQPSSTVTNNFQANAEGEREEDQATDKFEDSKPAEVPDSEATNPDTNNEPDVDSINDQVPNGKTGHVEDVEEQEEGDHVVEGDEDTAIY